jgi:hypothetical protein
MSNKELFQKVRDLNFPQGQYALFGSTPMGVRGIRESRDADIIVTGEFFNVLKSSGEWKIKFTIRNTEVLIDEAGDIEILKDWGPGDWNIRELINGSEVIDDLPFVKLEEVLKWKNLLTREKDYKDVELITEHIRNGGK